MKRACRFCPAVQRLEDRTVLSFSFSKMLHSIFPFIPDNEKKAKPKPHPAGAVVTPLHPGPKAAGAAKTPHVAPHPVAPDRPAVPTRPRVAHPRGVLQWHLPIPGQNGRLG